MTTRAERERHASDETPARYVRTAIFILPTR